MANLVETSRWEAGIYQFETSDPVMGGPNGIDNRPTRELANRTLWLKNELAQAVASIGANKTSADQALALKADKAVRMIAGAGLSGGGDLSADRTIALATPSTLNGSTTNWVGNGATGHTHELAKATPTLAGVAKLVNVLDSSATDAAVSAAMAKKLQDEKLGNSGNQTLSGQLNIFRNAWEKIRFSNADGSFWRFESAPVSSGENGARFNYIFTGADGSEVGRISFPRVSTGETVAYQSWVSTQIGAAVMLTGNQTIEGTKTFSSIQEFSNGLRFSTPAKNIWGVLAMDSNGVYLSNPASNKFIKLTDGGELQYGGEKVFTYFDRSDSYTLDDTSKLATSRALKLLNDVSASVNTSITAGNGLTGGGTLAASRTLALGTPGTITASSTNAVQAAGHTHAIDKASLTVEGVVQLSSATDSTAVNMAATPAAVRAAMQEASQATPIGTIAYFAGDSAPAGWLKANGAQVSRSVYANLFAAISTRFGAGNGSTTFTLPDLRGVFLRGFDDGRGFDGGRVLGSLQNHNLAEHRHATGWRINNTGNEFALVRNNWSGEVAVTANVSSGNVAVIPGDAESYSQAEGISHAATNDRYATSRAYYDAQGETRPTNVALLACIKI